MRLPPTASLSELAFIVSSELTKGGLKAVLSGGGAATYWSGGVYQSHDLDFIVTMHYLEGHEGAVMAPLGFERRGRSWYHPDTSFTVEFPPGPLMIGEDHITEWATESDGERTLQILNPTDSVRDRLCAFYFWRDLSALIPAFAIAARFEVDWNLVRAWSDREGMAEKFEEFMLRLKSRP